MMVDQSVFMDTLHSVKDIIATSETPMGEADILAYFKDMDLDLNQKNMVLDYLMNPANYNTEEETSKPEQEETEQAGDDEEPESKVDVYQMYMDEVGELATISEEELDGYYRRLLQGDESVIEIIASAWLVRVTQLATEYMDPKLVLEDLIQEGNLALFMELKTLCGSMSKDSIEERLNQTIERGIVDYASEIRDAKEIEDTIVGKVNLMKAAMDVLAEENGTEPTVEELASYTNMSVEELTGLKELIEESRGE